MRRVGKVEPQLRFCFEGVDKSVYYSVENTPVRIGIRGVDHLCDITLAERPEYSD